MDISSVIKKHRERLDLTLAELSEQTGLSISFISDLERGRSNPSVDTVEKIANGFGISIAEMLSSPEAQLPEDELKLLSAYRKRNIKALVRLIADRCQ